MPTTNVLKLNSKDVADFGAEVVDTPGLFGHPPRLLPHAPIASRVGVVVLATDYKVDQREGAIELLVKGSSNSDLFSKLDALAAWCNQGLMTVWTARNNGRVLYAYLTAMDPVPYNPKHVTHHAKVTIGVQAKDPRWFNTADTPIAFTTATAMPLGSAPVWPLLEITGSATAPITITLKNAAGTTIGTLIVNTALGAGEILRINNWDGLIQKVVSGTPSNVINTLVNTPSPSRFPLVLKQEDANLSTTTWPSLATDKGTGSAIFQRAWWTG